MRKTANWLGLGLLIACLLGAAIPARAVLMGASVALIEPEMTQAMSDDSVTATVSWTPIDIQYTWNGGDWVFSGTTYSVITVANENAVCNLTDVELTCPDSVDSAYSDYLTNYCMSNSATVSDWYIKSSSLDSIGANQSAKCYLHIDPKAPQNGPVGTVNMTILVTITFGSEPSSTIITSPTGESQ